MQDMLKFMTAATGGMVTLLWGQWSQAMTILLVLVVIDILTGWMAGYITKSLSSGVGFIGIMRKTAIFLVLAVAYHLDTILNTGGLLMQGSTFFYIANEGLSILENAKRMKLPLPSNLSNALEELDTKKEEKEPEK